MLKESRGNKSPDHQPVQTFLIRKITPQTEISTRPAHRNENQRGGFGFQRENKSPPKRNNRPSGKKLNLHLDEMAENKETEDVGRGNLGWWSHRPSPTKQQAGTQQTFGSKLLLLLLLFVSATGWRRLLYNLYNRCLDSVTIMSLITSAARNLNPSKIFCCCCC